MGDKKFEEKTRQKIKDYLDKTEGNEFSFGEFKKEVFGYTQYGGGKFKRKLIELFDLEETKDGSVVLLKTKRKS
jgi:hypothetical protein